MSLYRKLQGLQTLANRSDNPHEAAVARKRADELLTAHPEAATPLDWRDLSMEERRAILDRLSGEIGRSLIRSSRRQRAISKEEAARQMAAITTPKLSNQDKALLRSGMGKQRKRPPRGGISRRRLSIVRIPVARRLVGNAEVRSW